MSTYSENKQDNAMYGYQRTWRISDLTKLRIGAKNLARMSRINGTKFQIEMPSSDYRHSIAMRILEFFFIIPLHISCIAQY